jgi:hypothetical protein
MNKSELQHTEIIPIGKPIAHTQIYLLDTNLQLIPPGLPGEICIGGAGLARGYLNNPILTADKFVPNPFTRKGMIYKSGDMGKWLPNGNLLFLGRKDEQVKINGYRIELSEIEFTLEKHADISKAVVLAKQGEKGEKHLVAFLECSGEINVMLIRDFLSLRLPSYMIPVSFVRVDSFPVTHNGKTDRNRLLERDGLKVESGLHHVAPENETEKTLAEIFAGILLRPLEEINVIENIFSLGFNSLKIILASKRINEALDRTDSVTVLFMYPSVKEMADYILTKGALNQIDEEYVSNSAHELEETMMSFNALNELENE